jgi:hypothetical protein
MAWGEAAAEQAEKDQPSEPRTCLRPDGASPELPPLEGREDFESRIGHVLSRHRTWSNFGEWQNRAERLTYAEEQVRKLETEEDQLVLMRAAQILDAAEERRRNVMRKAGIDGRG